MTHTNETTVRKRLRLWPGLASVVLILLAKVLMPIVGTYGPGLALSLLAGMAGALLILLWWLLFSRAPWVERLGAPLVMAAAFFIVKPFVHPSIAGGGQTGGQGTLLFALALPVMCIGLVLWAAATQRLSTGMRRVTMVATLLIACGVFTLVRTGGISGEGDADLHLRWTPTPEERLLAADVDPKAPTPPAPERPKDAAPASAAPAPEAKATPSTAPPPTPAAAAVPAADPVRKPEWPGFRGPNRDNVIRGVRINTDWNAAPPVELWRRAVGPGWSSFAVTGDYIYTQEQRGEDEVISCYRFSTGEPVWRHRDAARFYESVGGPGPRATPTIHNGRVYAMGATGIVNALDTRTGARVWSRNAATDAGAADPGWGFTASPIVVNDVLVAAASGVLIAYDLATGNPRWKGPQGGGGYSSPHFVTLDGVPQIVLLRGRRTISVSPGDGRLLWEHAWEPGASIVQPAVIGNRDLIINHADTMGGQGLRRLSLSRGASGWNIEERWTTRGLKPYYNDFVIHGGHAYGFDGNILASIDLATGERKWKGGRYGHGQMLLLADQDVLLLISEDGDLAIVSATPDKYTEVAKFKAIEGKTWNHPVLVGDVLLIRNGEEMAAFRLSRAPRLSSGRP